MLVTQVARQDAELSNESALRNSAVINLITVDGTFALEAGAFKTDFAGLGARGSIRLVCPPAP